MTQIYILKGVTINGGILYCNKRWYTTSTASIVTLALPLGGVCDQTHPHHPISFQLTDKARSMGTLVNNDTTSDDTSSYFSGMVIDFKKGTYSELLETNKLELPTSGDSARARCLERVYVGDETNETMGLRGIPGL